MNTTMSTKVRLTAHPSTRVFFQSTAALLARHATGSEAVLRHVIDKELNDEEAARLRARLADGWALALITTLATPPTVSGTVTKPGEPSEEVFRLEVRCDAAPPPPGRPRSPRRRGDTP